MSYEREADYILQVARRYFPFVDEETFGFLFKLTPAHVAKYLFRSRISRFRATGMTEKQKFRMVRNFIMVVYWCRNYPSFRALAVLFGLRKTQAKDITTKGVRAVAMRIQEFVNLDGIDSLDDFFLKNCVGAVDTTELQIWTWVGDSYSGKKKQFTLKYQVVVSLITGKAIQISGPYFGKASDAYVWNHSGMADYLEQEGIWVLGDRGYQGCRRVYNCLKRRKGETRLPLEKKEYNRNISRKRVLVENHFADLRVFTAVKHCFRGHVDNHFEIFHCCEILLAISQS